MSLGPRRTTLQGRIVARALTCAMVLAPELPVIAQNRAPRPDSATVQQQVDARAQAAYNKLVSQARQLKGSRLPDDSPVAVYTLGGLLLVRDTYVRQLVGYISILSDKGRASNAQKLAELNRLLPTVARAKFWKDMLAHYEGDTFNSSMANTHDYFEMQAQKAERECDQLYKALDSDSMVGALMEQISGDITPGDSSRYLRQYNDAIDTAKTRAHAEINRAGDIDTVEGILEFKDPQYERVWSVAAGTLGKYSQGMIATLPEFAAARAEMTEAKKAGREIPMAIIVGGIVVVAILVPPLAVAAGATGLASVVTVGAAGTTLVVSGVQLYTDGQNYYAMSTQAENARAGAVAVGQRKVDQLDRQASDALKQTSIDVGFVVVDAVAFGFAVREARALSTLDSAGNTAKTETRAALKPTAADQASIWSEATAQSQALRQFEEAVSIGPNAVFENQKQFYTALKTDPQAMRSLKNAPVEVRRMFNELENAIYRPQNEAVTDWVKNITVDKSGRPPAWAGRELQIGEFRTPGADPLAVNTDRDFRVLYKSADGSWIEVPQEYWRDVATNKFAQITEYSTQKVRSLASPEELRTWDTWKPSEHGNMTAEQAMQKKWGELHQQLATDKWHPEASIDFSDQVKNGGIPKQVERPNIQQVREGKTMLEDAERMGMMYNEKADAYLRLKSSLHPGGDKLEAMAQLNKGTGMLDDVRSGYQRLFAAAGQEAPLPAVSDRFRKASDAIRKLAPFDKSIGAERIAEVEKELQGLGFGVVTEPGNPLRDFTKSLDSQFTALKTVSPPTAVSPPLSLGPAGPAAAAAGTGLNQYNRMTNADQTDTPPPPGTAAPTTALPPGTAAANPCDPKMSAIDPDYGFRRTLRGATPSAPGTAANPTSQPSRPSPGSAPSADPNKRATPTEVGATPKPLDATVK